MSQIKGKRKRVVNGPSTSVFSEEDEEKKENLLLNFNAEEDDDSSDADLSDLDDDDDDGESEEEEEEAEDINRESDSPDEDDIEDVSGEEEEMNDESSIEGSDDDDEEIEGSEDDREESNEEEDEEEDKDSPEEENGESQQGITKVRNKVDRDSGFEDMSQEGTANTKEDKKSKSKVQQEETVKLSLKKILNRADNQQKIAHAPARWREYQEDSSDEEDLRNTMGNIPLKWYDEYPHLGYNLEGEKILKPEQGDTLDEFLNRMENPDYNRTVLDKQTGQQVRLSDGDLNVVKRVMGNQVPNRNYDMYAPWIDFFTYKVRDMPISGRPEHKRSFTVSKSEATWVAKRAEKIRRGLIRYPHRKRKQEALNPGIYDLWASDEPMRRIHNHLPAPRVNLPSHRESYNPPPEYTKRGVRYTSVRSIPAYSEFINDRYERCLDLYIAPRKRIMRITAKSKDLLPQLPKPQDLQPFPSREGLIFKGHRSIVRSISVHPLGKYLASGSDDHTVKIWEISTGRCLRSFDVEGAVKWVAWNPSTKLFLLAIVFDNKVIFMNPETYLLDKIVVQQTNSVFMEEPDQGDYIQPERVRTAVTWKKPTPDEWAKGYRIILEHFRSVKQIVWQKQGDYFATVIPEGDHRSVLMHQLSRWRSQVPFNKCKGRVQCAQFHPKLPFLYVATQSHIRVYNLQKQRLLKKVQANTRWISSIAIHPGGEHFLIGGYDRKLNWFEMEYTRRPIMLRYHREAVRSVAFHRKYPLFASASDEGRVIISHGMVYNDWLKDPFIVPVKELHGHNKFRDLYALDVAWHPFEPFVFTSGADATIRLWH